MGAGSVVSGAYVRDTVIDVGQEVGVDPSATAPRGYQVAEDRGLVVTGIGSYDDEFLTGRAVNSTVTSVVICLYLSLLRPFGSARVGKDQASGL